MRQSVLRTFTTVVLTAGVALAPVRADAAALPDLVTSAMSAPGSVVRGDSIKVSTTVANLRGSRAPYSYLRVYLSRDRAAGTGDRVLGTRKVLALASDATSTRAATYPIPSGTGLGQWYVVACADATRRVKEYREGNNCRSVGLKVKSPNRAPVAVDDAQATDEDVAAVIDPATLLFNDTDPDGQALAVVGVSDALPSGSAVGLTGGQITFTPAADFHGTASFAYTVADPNGLQDVAVVEVEVSPVNDAPVAVDDEGTTTQDEQVVIPTAALLANDVDVDVDTLVVTAVGSATNGVAVLGQSGVTFTPSGGFTGEASFDYTLSDGATTDVGLVTVTVAPPAQAIVVGNPVTGPLVEGTTHDLSITLATAPAGDVVVSAESADTATVGVGSPTLTFTPVNWDTPQLLTLTAEHDDDLADDSALVTLSALGLASQEITVDVDDDDVQVVLSSTSNAAVTEGSTSLVGVRLAFQPPSGTTVSCSSGDPGAATVSPSQLNFTTANWSVYQNLTIGGVSDVDLAAESVTITCTAPGATQVQFGVAVTDDDSQAVQSSSAALSVGEGAADTVDITLAYQPPSGTTVTCSSADTLAVSVSPGTLSFSPANWSTPQTINLGGVIDADTADEEVIVTCSAPGAQSVQITVTVIDPD
jgi:hypothetical protein